MKTKNNTILKIVAGKVSEAVKIEIISELHIKECVWKITYDKTVVAEGKEFGSAKRIVLESEGKANYFMVICPMDKGAIKPQAKCGFADGKTIMTVEYNGHKYEITFTKDDIFYKCDNGAYYTF